MSATLLTTDWKLTFKIFNFCGALLGHLFCWSFDLKGIDATGQWVGSSAQSYLRCGVLTACHQTVQCWNLVVHNWGTSVNSVRVRTTICASLHPSLHTRCSTTVAAFTFNTVLTIPYCFAQLPQGNCGGLGPGLTSMSCERAMIQSNRWNKVTNLQNMACFKAPCSSNWM